MARITADEAYEYDTTVGKLDYIRKINPHLQCPTAYGLSIQHCIARLWTGWDPRPDGISH